MSFNPHEDATPSGASRPSLGDPTATSHRDWPRATAVRGRVPGREGWTGATEGDGLGAFLGWFSVGLGALEIIAPHAMARAVGLRPSSGVRTVMQAMGLRELATGAAILMNPTSKEWVGMRIGGDVLDLAALGAALPKAERPGRTLLAAAFVMCATALDIVGTERLAERRKAPTRAVADAPNPVVLRSITVGRPVAEVFAFWRDFTNFPSFMRHVEAVEPLANGRTRWRATGPGGASVEWESEVTEETPNEVIAWRSVDTSELYNSGRVTFRPASNDEGAVVTVEMHYAPPGGLFGAALLKLFRKEPGQQVGDDLRRFKQVMEIGEIVTSDASSMPPPAAARPHELH